MGGGGGGGGGGVGGGSLNDHWASTCYLQLAQMASCKADFLCTL